MKGLRKYIKRHGNHFTEKLAHDVCKFRWDAVRVKQSIQKQVYYNVTGSTDGDMIYLMDTFKYYLSDQYSYEKGLRLTLSWVGDYKKSGSPFCIWITTIAFNKEDFDFTPYI